MQFLQIKRYEEIGSSASNCGAQNFTSKFQLSIATERSAN